MSVPSSALIVNNYKLQNRYVAHLVTDFTFTKYSCAAQFINDISSICRIHMFNFSFHLNLCIHSKYHSSTFTLHNHGRPLQLTLYLQTIQAFCPRWNQEDSSAIPLLSCCVPGITHRDLCFAILFEQLYNTFLYCGKATQTRGT